MRKFAVCITYSLCFAPSIALSATQPTPVANPKVLFGFGPAPDSVGPSGGLAVDSSGRLVGAALTGGREGYGTIFRLTPPTVEFGPWTEEILHAFTGFDGMSPNGALLIDASGLIYGTTQTGGKYNYGTVFQLNPDTGALRTMKNFGAVATDGKNPAPGLVFGPGNLIYGTTSNGGKQSGGTIFSISPTAWTGQYNILHSFGSTKDDALNPYSGLVAANAMAAQRGQFFGLSESGKSGAGVVFRFNLDLSGKWHEHVIHSFGVSDGDIAYPPGQGGIVVGKDSHLFACARWLGPNGANSFGGVAEIAPSATGKGTWVETLIYLFSSTYSNVHGSNCALAIEPSGAVLGTDGRSGDQTEIYELQPPTGGGSEWAYTQLSSTLSMSLYGGFPGGGFLRLGASYYGEFQESLTGGGTIIEVRP